MTGRELRETRKRLQWTQQQATAKLGVSQPYLSLLENGRRRVPPRVVTRLARYTTISASTLPLTDETALRPQAFAASLGALGYPPFAYLSNAKHRRNPATLLLMALRQDHLEPRLTEALPWVLLHYPNLDWQWLVDRAKHENLQNRLGFLVSLARDLAQTRGLAAPVAAFAKWEQTLEDARLAKVDSLARGLTPAERQYFQVHRSAVAAHWNLLTSMTAETLRYAE
ncbi:MAG: helix-turn-helix domain-containing protein [Vicinamibacterales bacterium]|nr:helix-turn-helix domain-containing protein [Vicinamibacterales bacterium]